jgi:hypothetical protein
MKFGTIGAGTVALAFAREALAAAGDARTPFHGWPRFLGWCPMDIGAVGSRRLYPRAL